MTDLLDLKGKVVLITGSSRGIGRAMAEMFAEAGARVVVSSRKREACEPVAEAIRAKGGEALVVPCHIGNADDLQNLVDTTIREWGRIDVLVPNAAINPVYGPMQDLDDAVFDKMLVTNVRTINTMCKMVLPGMAENGGGSVVIISSVAAIDCCSLAVSKLGAVYSWGAGEYGSLGHGDLKGRLAPELVAGVRV
ncbi:MAG: SDR family NAD(P)-dependent oxidoreductase, partial [Pseudomonadota bacterium]|nr:SDR family NAD(P)-dependent oxidoreductase [Pseudomonadota bacterium]